MTASRTSGDVVAVITRIGYGGDVWEVRIDLVTPIPGPVADHGVPPLSYIEEQVKLLQSIGPLPLLSAMRTKSQRGKFKDDAYYEALALVPLAVKQGLAYVDVELGRPAYL
ncbi:uncharacterized protein PV09_04504 [Verruconis gallopava]|uniref:Uncharacterized protein n=1 Tax=Verruconis gallopava TaxID=253628 RepID=A0A0D1XNP5_9PEZI|nr:uncharacterized protein PV09_04504 [Verruconis gallopava]KIW04196.1 hypothetical protein PV09_04504 [Verruconis gallopava]